MEQRKRGRPPGATSKAKRDLMEMAKGHAPAALKTLVAIAGSSKHTASARVSAATAILDRAYGKPPQLNTGSADEFNKITEMSDDELYAIAGRGRVDQAEGNPPVTH